MEYQYAFWAGVVSGQQHLTSFNAFRAALSDGTQCSGAEDVLILTHTFLSAVESYPIGKLAFSRDPASLVIRIRELAKRRNLVETPIHHHLSIGSEQEFRQSCTSIFARTIQAQPPGMVQFRKYTADESLAECFAILGYLSGRNAFPVSGRPFDMELAVNAALQLGFPLRVEPPRMVQLLHATRAVPPGRPKPSLPFIANADSSSDDSDFEKVSSDLDD